MLDNGILAYNFKTLGQGDEFASIWGVYTGKYHLLINVPMAISNALSSSLIPSVSRAVAMGDKKLDERARGIRDPVLLYRCDPVYGGTHGACGTGKQPFVLRG